MLRRLTLALGLLSALAISANAQEPEETPLPAVEPTVQPEVQHKGGISAFLRSIDMQKGNDRRFYASADYLFTFMSGSNLPVLATTSDPGTARGVAGIFGAAGSSPLFGGGAVDDRLRAGFRFEFGWWCNPERNLAVEAGFTMIESQAALFSRNANDGSILARPFTDARNGTPQAVLVAFPGSSTGSLDIRAASGNFYGGHVNLAEKAIETDSYRLFSLLGYRFYRYDENIRINQVVNPTDPNFVPGTQVVTNDRFTTRNSFHGLDLGFRSQFFWNNVKLDVLTKVAVGRIFRLYDAAGDQTITVPGAAPLARDGGVLALSSNNGTFTSRDWKVMPEAGVTLSWQARSYLNVRAGYSFLYLQGVARAADQIDTTINPNLFPGNSITGALRPAANHTRTDMWIQTLNFGVEFTY